MFRKFLATAVSLVFFGTNVALVNAAETNIWAERRKLSHTPQFAAVPTPLGGPSIDPADLLKKIPEVKALEPTLPTQLKKLNPYLPRAMSAFLSDVPLNRGTLRDVYVSRQHPDGSLVLLLQDVHMNIEAQENIAGVLLQLTEKHPALLVGVEGAFGSFDFTWYRSFKNKELVKAVADCFLKMNKIAAPSFVGLTATPAWTKFVGVDDKKEYDANVEAYRSSVNLKNGILEKLKTAHRDITDRKNKMLNPALSKMDQQMTSYHRGRVGFGSYVKYLSEQWDNVADKDKDEFAEGTELEIEKFLAAYRLEKTLDFARVDRERVQVVNQLARKMEKTDIEHLVADALAFQAGKITFGDYYRDIQSLIQKKGILLDQTPAFQNYIHYVLLSDGVKVDVLMDAVSRMEKRVLSSLAKTPIEKELMSLSNQLYLISRLVNFSLTPDEWEDYKASKSMNRTTLFADSDLSSFEQFYISADKRSDRMIKNLIGQSSENDTSQTSKAMVLLAGGFHTPQLAQLLKKKDISFAVLQPKITKITDEEGTEYLSIFTKEKTPLDKLFEGEKLFLAPASLALGSDPRGPAKTVTTEAHVVLGGVASNLGESIPEGTKLEFQPAKQGEVSVTQGGQEYEVRIIPRDGSSRVTDSGRYELVGFGDVEVRSGRSFQKIFEFTPAVWMALLETFIPTLASYVSHGDHVFLAISALSFWFLHQIARLIFVQLVRGQALNHRDVMKFFTGLVGSLLIFFPFFNERPLDAAAALSAFIHVVWNGVLAPMFPNLVPLLMVKSEMEDYEKTFRETRMGKLVIRDTKYYDFARYYLSGNPDLANSPELVKLFKLLLNQERIISKKRNRKDFPSQNHLVEFLLKTLVKSKDQSRWINFINENHENLARLNSGILEELGENYTSRGVFLFESDLDYFVRITNKDAAEMVISFIKNFDEENDGPHPLRAYTKTDQGLRNLNQLTKKKADHIAYIGDQDGDAYKDFSIFLVESKAKFEDIEYLPREVWEYFNGGVDYLRFIENTYGPKVLLCLIENFQEAQKETRVSTMKVQAERNYIEENREKFDAIYGRDGLSKFIKNPSTEVLKIMAQNSLDDIQKSMKILLRWVRQDEINLLFSTKKAGGIAEMLRFARDRKNVERLDAYIDEMRTLSVPYFDIDIFLYRVLNSDQALDFISLVSPAVVAQRMKDNYALVIGPQNFQDAFQDEALKYMPDMSRFLANVIQYAKDRSVSAQLTNYRIFLVEDMRGGTPFMFEWLGKLFSLTNRRVGEMAEANEKAEELKSVAKILKLQQEIVSRYRGKEIPDEIKVSLSNIVDPNKTSKQIFEDLNLFRDSLMEKVIAEIIAPAEAQYIKTNFPLIWARLRQIVIQVTSLGHMSGRGHELGETVKKIMHREVNNLIPTTRDRNNYKLSHENSQILQLTSDSELPFYMRRILDKGIEVDLQAQPLTKAQKEIELKTKWIQLTEELVQIFTELEFQPEGKTAENVRKVAFPSLADVVQAMDELRAAFRDSYPPRLLRVQDMQEDFVKLDASFKKNADSKESASSQTKPKSVQVIIKKDFLTEASVGMLPFSGCFITGAGHDEMPFIHALEKNGMIATIRDAEGNVLSNAVLVFGKEGVLVFPAYSEIGAYNYDQVWLEALKTLSNYVPKIVLYPPATSMPASAGFNSAVSENISPVEYAKPVTITKPYRYLVAYYTDETSGTDEAKSQQYVKWKFKKATVLKRGQFPEHKISVLRARQKEKENQQQRESLKARFLNSKRDGFSKGLFGLGAQAQELRAANFGPLLGTFESILLRGNFQELVSALMPRGNGAAPPITENGKEMVRSYIQKFINENKDDVDNFQKQYASIGKTKSSTKTSAAPASFLHLVFQRYKLYNTPYAWAFKIVAWASVAAEWQISMWVYDYAGYMLFALWIVGFALAHYFYEMWSLEKSDREAFNTGSMLFRAIIFGTYLIVPSVSQYLLVFHASMDLLPIALFQPPFKLNPKLRAATESAYISRAENKDVEIKKMLTMLLQIQVVGLDETVPSRDLAIKYLHGQIGKEKENSEELLALMNMILDIPKLKVTSVNEIDAKRIKLSKSQIELRIVDKNDTMEAIAQIREFLPNLRKEPNSNTKFVFRVNNQKLKNDLETEFSFSRNLTFVCETERESFVMQFEELIKRWNIFTVDVMVSRRQAFSDSTIEALKSIRSIGGLRVNFYLLLEDALKMAIPISVDDLTRLNMAKERLLQIQA